LFVLDHYRAQAGAAGVGATTTEARASGVPPVLSTLHAD
jgi:hypothetical protein